MKNDLFVGMWTYSVKRCSKALMLVLGFLSAIGVNSFAQNKISSAFPDPAINCCYAIDYQDSNGQPVFGYMAKIDLTKVAPMIPSLPSPPSCPQQYPNPAFTPEIAATTNPSVSLAINANFFWWDHDKNFHDLSCEAALGLAIQNGKTISAPGQGINHTDVLPDTVLFFSPGTNPQIVQQPTATYKPPSGVRTAISGILILVNGKDVSNRAKNAQIEWDEKVGRTAIGFTSDRKVLMVIAIEGEVPRSAGISLPDLAALFLSFGATDVLNLDGGGSTAFNYFAGPKYQIMTTAKDKYPNKEGFSQYRPVPVNLVFSSSDQPIIISNRYVKGTGIPLPVSYRAENLFMTGAFNFLNAGPKLSLAASRSVGLLPATSVIAQATSTAKAPLLTTNTAQTSDSGPLLGLTVNTGGQVTIRSTPTNTPLSVYDSTGTRVMLAVSDYNSDRKLGNVTIGEPGENSHSRLTVHGPIEGYGTVPIGAVIDWWEPSHTQEGIPPNFAVCDGQIINDRESPYYGHDTPDLRGMFIYGAADEDHIGNTGGSATETVNMTIQLPAETGRIPLEVPSDANKAMGLIIKNKPTTNYRFAATSEDVSKHDGQHVHSLGGDVSGTTTVSIMPPYYTLLKIMRIK
jgi:hypothetical protein